MYKRGPYLQVGPAAIQKLQRLQQRPPVPLHYKRGECASGPALPPDRVHQDTLSSLMRLLYELKDRVGRLILLVENDLQG